MKKTLTSILDTEEHINWLLKHPLYFSLFILFIGACCYPVCPPLTLYYYLPIAAITAVTTPLSQCLSTGIKATRETLGENSAVVVHSCQIIRTLQYNDRTKKKIPLESSSSPTMLTSFKHCGRSSEDPMNDRTQEISKVKNVGEMVYPFHLRGS